MKTASYLSPHIIEKYVYLILEYLIAKTVVLFILESVCVTANQSGILLCLDKLASNVLSVTSGNIT
jgi:hypothetical protein